MMLRVLIFVKYPEVGRVKTRLASSIGARKAVKIYRRMVEEQVRQIPRGAELQVHFSPAEKGDEFRDWLGSEFEYRPQCDGELGDRLIHGLRTAFDEAEGPVVVIGGDCPDLDAKVLGRARKALKKHDVVIGPASDGGYYLLGMNQFRSDLFEEIDWSTEQVLGQTLNKLVVAGLSFDLLEILDDIDDEESLREIRPEWLDSLE